MWWRPAEPAGDSDAVDERHRDADGHRVRDAVGHVDDLDADVDGYVDRICDVDRRDDGVRVRVGVRRSDDERVRRRVEQACRFRQRCEEARTEEVK